LPLEREVTHHALVEQHAQREDVGAHVDFATLDLLGSHVRWRAENLPCRRHALRIEHLGDPEVGELDDDTAIVLAAPRCGLGAVDTSVALAPGRSIARAVRLAVGGFYHASLHGS